MGMGSGRCAMFELFVEYSFTVLLFIILSVVYSITCTTVVQYLVLFVKRNYSFSLFYSLSTKGF